MTAFFGTPDFRHFSGPSSKAGEHLLNEQGNLLGNFPCMAK